MPHIGEENARRARTGAEVGSTGRLNTTSCIPSGPKAQPLVGPRFERQVEHLHRLGPRAVGEFLAEIVTATDEPDVIAARLEEYSRLDPEILRFVGGDKFPPRVLGVLR